MHHRDNRTSLLALLVAAGVAHRLPAQAALHAGDHEPEWGALARSSAATRSTSTSRPRALQDVHRVEAKPSLVARARNADLSSHRRRARDRLAAGAAAGIGQRAHPAGSPGYFEAARLAAAARSALQRRPVHGRCAPAGNPHVQTRSAQHRGGGDALARACAGRSAPTRRIYQARGRIFSSAGSRRSRAGARRPRRSRACRSSWSAHRTRSISATGWDWGGRRDRAEARRAADRVATWQELVTKLKGRAAEDDPAQCLQRSQGGRTGWPSASTCRWCCCRFRSAARRREGPVSALRRHVNRLLGRAK
jgi:hypothetical protein